MKVPVALPVDESPLPAWEDGVTTQEVAPLPIDRSALESVLSKEVSLPGLLIAIAGLVFYWLRKAARSKQP